jgi:predicted transcriptional regulator
MSETIQPMKTTFDDLLKKHKELKERIERLENVAITLEKITQKLIEAIEARRT